MFDSLTNLIFLLIPLAIFLGRIVVDARNKRNSGGATGRTSRAPLRSEDDDEPKYFRKRASTQSPAAAPRRTQTARKPTVPLAPALSSPISEAAAGPKAPLSRVNAARMVSPEHQSFPLNLTRLPPLKQAVVMAEVLGPPKGLME